MPKFKHTLWKHTFHIDIFLIVRLFLCPIQLQPVIPSAIQLHEHICISFQIDKILHHKNRNRWEQATKIIKPNQRTSQICTDTRSEWGKKCCLYWTIVPVLERRLRRRGLVKPSLNLCFAVLSCALSETQQHFLHRNLFIFGFHFLLLHLLLFPFKIF